MKLYSYCTACSKKAYREGEQFLSRQGEGYIILSTSQGIENIKTCYKCDGTGIIFIKNIKFNEQLEEWA